MRDIKYGISMLVNLKQAALSAEMGSAAERTLSKAAGGSGMFVIASNIDSIIQTILENQTELANYKFSYGLDHAIVRQWQDLGFEEDPDDMTETQRQELRQTALRFYGTEEE